MNIDPGMKIVRSHSPEITPRNYKPSQVPSFPTLPRDSLAPGEITDSGLIRDVKTIESSAPVADKPETIPVKDMYITIAGSPGAGKTTQGELLSRRYGIPHVSVGRLLRGEIARGTTLGLMVESYVKSGELCPSHITAAVVKNRLTREDCRNGFILDGFPRRADDNKAFEGIMKEMGIKNYRMILLKADPDVVIERFKHRRVCEQGHSYDLKNSPPKEEGKCDHDGLPLKPREDDKPDIIRHRFYVYENETRPVIDYYKEQGRCTVVDGNGGIGEVNRMLTDILDPVEETEKPDQPKT